jgi:hypothetical protein
MGRKTLLGCGILASFLYVAVTLFVGMLLEAYSSWSQTTSDLSSTRSAAGLNCIGRPRPPSARRERFRYSWRLSSLRRLVDPNRIGS